MRLILATNLIIGALLSSVYANCFFAQFPGNGQTCNLAPVADTGVEILFQVTENVAGDCRAQFLAVGDSVTESATISYTNILGAAAFATALNTVTLSAPGIIGTYPNSFNVPYTSISPGSPVTAFVKYWYTAGIFPITTTISATWTESNLPTILQTDSTSTSTTGSPVFLSSTSTITTTLVSVFTPPAVESTVITGTRTIRVRPTSTETSTITLRPRTVTEAVTVTQTTTITCFSRGPNPIRKRAITSYVVPSCGAGAFSTTTVFTATVTVFAAAPVTFTNTILSTETDTSTLTLDAVTTFDDIRTTITTTLPPVTRTIRSVAPRQLATTTITVTVQDVILPLGNRTPFCTRPRPVIVFPPANPFFPVSPVRGGGNPFGGPRGFGGFGGGFGGFNPFGPRH